MAGGTRIAVIGAGGIGAFYVARLAAAGVPVVAVARGSHLEAMRRLGLRVEHPELPFDGPVDACDLDTLCSGDPCDYAAVILLTKATATAQVARRLAGWLGDAPLGVASLQNGVDNEPLLEAILGRDRVVGGYSVRLGGHVVAPGHVRCVGECLTCIGPWPDAESAGATASATAAGLARTFDRAGLATEVHADIRREIWRKLVLNAAVNPLSALLEWDTRQLSHDARVSPLVRAIMDETVRVGRAEGTGLTAADADHMFALIRAFPPIRTSMLVDLDQGRELELDAIAGAVLGRAQRHGIAAPVLDTVTRLLEAKLAGRSGPGA